MKDEAEKKNVLTALICLIMLVIVVFSVVYVINKIEVMIEAQKEPEITNFFISEKIETMSELTSAELFYNGLIRYTDGDIPFINKKEFSMLYCAHVEAGFDLSKASAEVTETSVIITLPQVDIQEVYVDPDSIEFFDEKAALFNWTEKEDAVDAIKDAEKDVMEKANIGELKERAKEQTEAIFKGMFQDSIGERTLIIKYEE